MQEIKIVLGGKKESSGLEKRINQLESAFAKVNTASLLAEIKSIKKMIPKDDHKDKNQSALMRKIEMLDDKFYKIMSKLDKVKNVKEQSKGRNGSMIVPYAA